MSRSPGPCAGTNQGPGSLKLSRTFQGRGNARPVTAGSAAQVAVVPRSRHVDPQPRTEQGQEAAKLEPTGRAGPGLRPPSGALGSPRIPGAGATASSPSRQ